MTDGPRRLGGFTLYGELGRGGFGTVYLGVDDEGRQAAVKELHPHMLEDAHARELFRRELEAARGVRGFCTASVLDADADAERPWIASEYVEGPTLLAEVRDNGPRHGADLERLAVHTATALVAIHAAGVVHRDFKPDNILLAEDGPRVIDFGVARLAEAGAASTAAVGTVGYMAPEQLQGGRIDDRADVFAWGATMVYAGSGGQAFPGPNVGARMLRVIKGPPETGALTGYLRTIVLHCLAKDPEERPTARGVLDMLTGAEKVPPAPDPGTAAAGPTVRVVPPRRAAAAEQDTQAIPAAGVAPYAAGPSQGPPASAPDPAPVSSAPMAPPRPRQDPDRWSDPTGTPSGGGSPGGGPDPRARLAAAERHLLTGDGEAAEAPLQQAITGFDRAGDNGRADYARILLGDLHNVTGRHEEAWRLLDTLRERFERAGKRVHLARCLRGMALLDHGEVWEGRSGGGLGSLVGGLLSRRGGEPWRAEARLELAERSLLLFHELNHGRESARTRLVLGQVLSELGEAERAVDAFSQAVSGFEALGDRWWEARARRITAQTRFHAVMEPQMAVGVYTGPPREGKELSLVLDHARRAVRLCGKAGDQRGRIAAQIVLARAVWATLGHEGAQALQAEVSTSSTPSSGPGTSAQTAWYERMTTSDEVEALLETSAAEARSQGLERLAAQARLWQERFFHESPGVHVQGWELHKKAQEVPFEESGLTRGDRCAV